MCVRVGNIVTGNDEQTQFMVNLNVLPALLMMLDHSKKNIRKVFFNLKLINSGVNVAYLPVLYLPLLGGMLVNF